MCEVKIPLQVTHIIESGYSSRKYHINAASISVKIVIVFVIGC